MSSPFTSREWVLMALYEARDYVSRVSEATLHEDNDFADFELLELLERAIDELKGAFDSSQDGQGGASC
jgi:hypothetical protein